MTDDKNIAPCPFCAEVEVSVFDEENCMGQRSYNAHCPCCGAKGPDALTEAMAIKLWNGGAKS